MRPLHLAFIVRDLASTRHFYGEILGCAEGRSTDTWVDLDFFGNQISAHVGTPPAPAETRGQLDAIEVPMPHFGAVLEWREFESLSKRLREADVRFIIEPLVRFAVRRGNRRRCSSAIRAEIISSSRASGTTRGSSPGDDASRESKPDGIR